MLALVLVVLAAVAARSDAADERLYYAARDGRTKVLQRLLGEEGVLPDTPHESGMTALMWAASTGEAGAIAALLEGG
jgi:ankyrin repeat protein